MDWEGILDYIKYLSDSRSKFTIELSGFGGSYRVEIKE